jgi:hypothetical protein
MLMGRKILLKALEPKLERHLKKQHTERMSG